MTTPRTRRRSDGLSHHQHEGGDEQHIAGHGCPQQPPPRCGGQARLTRGRRGSDPALGRSDDPQEYGRSDHPDHQGGDYPYRPEIRPFWAGSQGGRAEKGDQQDQPLGPAGRSKKSSNLFARFGLLRLAGAGAVDAAQGHGSETDDRADDM